MSCDKGMTVFFEIPSVNSLGLGNIVNFSEEPLPHKKICYVNKTFTFNKMINSVHYRIRMKLLILIIDHFKNKWTEPVPSTTF